MEGYCLHHSYNKLELPSPKTHVKVNLEVLDIIRVDDRKFSVELNMYFGVVWTEPRLHLPKPFRNGTNRPPARCDDISWSMLHHEGKFNLKIN